MNEPKFTPPPWVLHDHQIMAENCPVALVAYRYGQGRSEETAANARLLASAADLYRAAAALADHYERSVDVGPGPHPNRETPLWGSLRAALARAGRGKAL